MAKKLEMPTKTSIAQSGSGTVIRACDCVHVVQDKIYGKGRRLHNGCKTGGPKCTVCGKKKA